MTAVQQTLTIAERAALVGETVAGPAADEVDREARFPVEALEALKQQGLLGVLVPTELGGPGASMSEVASAVTALSRHCASTAMIYAMHQIQVLAWSATATASTSVNTCGSRREPTSAGICNDRSRNRRRYPHERMRRRTYRRPLQAREERSGHLLRRQFRCGAGDRKARTRQRPERPGPRPLRTSRAHPRAQRESGTPSDSVGRAVSDSTSRRTEMSRRSSPTPSTSSPVAPCSR